MNDRLLSLLSREWSALAIGAMFALAGAPLIAFAGSTGSGRPAGVILLLVGLLLATGSLIHLRRLAHSRRRYPAPGSLIDIGGTRLHLLAEGRVQDEYPILWFGGGHSAGLAMDHLHRAFRERTRSILIDRPGTGWSDTGSFPRRTVEEAEEMVRALEAAGERGPFVLVGYSFGGLLAANIARRHPHLVARLVLLDATPLETIIFGPRLGALRQMRRESLLNGLLRLVGIPANLTERRIRRLSAHAASGRAFERALGPAVETLRGVEVSAGSQFASYSSYLDLNGPTIAERGWETVVYDGDLGEMPLWLVAPGNAEEVKVEAEIAAAGAGQARMLRFFARSRERYLATSSNARRIVTPEGTTHQFVYERPDFVAEVIEEAIRKDA